MSKFMTYAITNKYISLGEVEAPNAEAAVRKGEDIAIERGIDPVEIVAEPESEEE